MVNVGGDEGTLLVFHESDLAAGYVESLLFGLGKVLPLIKCKLRIIDERVVGVIVLLIFLLNECGSCKKTLEENEGATDPPLVSPLAAVLVVAPAVARVALVHANRWCGRTEARRAGDLSDIDLVVVWPA